VSTTTFALPSDEVLDIHIPGPPRSRFAKHYLELTGDEKRAERLDQCGKYQDIRCQHGHKKRKYHHCMDPFCRSCTIRLAHDTYKRWKGTLEFLESAKDLPPTVTFIEITLPLARDRAAAEEFLSSACDMIGGEEPGWVFLAGYNGANALLRMLVIDEKQDQCDAHHLQSWAGMFPVQAIVKVSIQPIHMISKVFREKLLAFTPSDDPIDRAEQSALFAGMRRLRACGIRQSAEEPEDAPTPYTCEEDLFAETDVLANKSFAEKQVLADTIISNGPPDPNICTHCGEPYTEQSQFFDADAPEPKEKDYRWYAKTH